MGIKGTGVGEFHKYKFKPTGELLNVLVWEEGNMVFQTNGSKEIIEHQELEKAMFIIDKSTELTEEEYKTEVDDFWKDKEKSKGLERCDDEAGLKEAVLAK